MVAEQNFYRRDRARTATTRPQCCRSLRGPPQPHDIYLRRLAVAFLSVRPLWQRIIIGLSAIPIAILCNVMRVTGRDSFIDGGPDWAEGFTHQFVGMVMLVPAFFLILMVCWILDHLFIEEVDGGVPVRKVVRRGPGGPSSGSTPGGATHPTGGPVVRPVPRGPDAPRRPLCRAADGGAL